MDKKELQRRAGITEQEDRTDQMMRMQRELADNWISGNIYQVEKTFQGLDSSMAVAMALRIYLYLSDTSGPQGANNFAKHMINAAR